jgi:hypothetical protein
MLSNRKDSNQMWLNYAAAASSVVAPRCSGDVACRSSLASRSRQRPAIGTANIEEAAPKLSGGAAVIRIDALSEPEVKSCKEISTFFSSSAPICTVVAAVLSLVVRPRCTNVEVARLIYQRAQRQGAPASSGPGFWLSGVRASRSQYGAGYCQFELAIPWQNHR